jgi:hypothetical protein
MKIIILFGHLVVEELDKEDGYDDDGIVVGVCVNTE